LISISAGEGRTEVRAEVFEVGSDLLIVIGGEGPHIGAATLVDSSDAEPQTLRVGRHREGELSDLVARTVSGATGRRTLTVAGIHLDRITKDEIEKIRHNVRQLAMRIAADSDRLSS
jgi:hypothetical protein